MSFRSSHDAIDYAVQAARYFKRWLTRGKLSMRRSARHLTTQPTTFRRHETTVEATTLKKTVRMRNQDEHGEVHTASGVQSEWETELNAYMRVQHLSNNTDPLMWWKQHSQEFRV